MRVKPAALVGVGIWALYAAIVVALQKTSGIPYTDFGDSTSNMWRGVVLSLLVGAVVIAGLALWMGWWGPAMRDQHRVVIRWTLIGPAIYLIIALSNVATTDWGNISAGFLLAAVSLGVLVGFAEEFVCRGMLLVGLRGTAREVVAWALSCVLFGVMHGANVFLGAAVGETVSQVLVAGAQGSAFYILRRVSGWLGWAMLLHGFWDFSIFVQSTSGVEPSIVNVLFGLLLWPAIILSLIGGFVLARRTQTEAVEDYAAAGVPAPATA